MKNKGKNVSDDFAQTFKELKNSSESSNSKDETVEGKAIVKKSIEKKSKNNDGKTTVTNNGAALSIEQNTIENNAIEQAGQKSEPIESIEKISMVKKSIEDIAIENKPDSPGIHPTSIRVVREELLKALAGLIYAEVKIGEIAPLTGLTRRTVDRVCKYLEKNGEFTFERQHRGMKITNLGK